MTAAELNDYATLIGTVAGLIGLFWVWRGRVLHRIRNWWRSVKARKQGTEAMVAAFPTISRFVADEKTRSDELIAREGRLTAQFSALREDLLGRDSGLREHLVSQDTKLDTIMAHQWGALKLDPQARFIRDAEGRNTEVNPAYAALLRVGEASLKGYGYKNYIDPGCATKFTQDVAIAFKEHRRIETIVILIRGDGTRFRANIRMEPYPEDPLIGPATHWFGAVMLVEELE